jgi:hypothetical protein
MVQESVVVVSSPSESSEESVLTSAAALPLPVLGAGMGNAEGRIEHGRNGQKVS